MEFFKKRTSIDFMGKRRTWYAISGTLMVASLLLIGFRGLNLGIDFTGGVVMELSFPAAANIDEVRGALEKKGYGDAVVQSFGTTRDVLVRLLPREGKNINAIGQDVLAAIKSYDPNAQLRRTEVVGSQVGAELGEQGAMAALFCFLFILGYVAIRFQWKLGLGAIVAAMHDPLIILGFFAATQLTFDLPTLAAILAIVGYSINDTVVVFDRIRERFVLTRKGTPTEIVNLAVNETLSRTIMTSVTTMITVLALLFLAGDTLRGFSIALTIGIVIGTYSSIYIASSIALDLKLTARDLLPVQKEKDAVDDMP
jgi:preprotein translocase subunit SecF